MPNDLEVVYGFWQEVVMENGETRLYELMCSVAARLHEAGRVWADLFRMPEVPPLGGEDLVWMEKVWAVMRDGHLVLESEDG